MPFTFNDCCESVCHLHGNRRIIDAIDSYAKFRAMPHDLTTTTPNIKDHHPRCYLGRSEGLI
jgi:hypothetical protein